MIFIKQMVKLHGMSKESKLYCFGPKYNLMKKYNALFPSNLVKRKKR